MTTERRQSSPAYRESVHQEAERHTQWALHDFDVAIESAQAAMRPGQMRRDVIGLLTRRRDTVNGLRPLLLNTPDGQNHQQPMTVKGATV